MDLTPIFIVGFLVLGTYKILELFVRKKERLAVIEKFISLTFESEKSIRLPNVLYETHNYSSWPLRISLLLIGVGLGCLFAFFTEMYYGQDLMRGGYRQNLIETASIAFFGGIGLFVAFMIELKKDNHNNN
jgi:hypothetical protein